MICRILITLVAPNPASDTVSQMAASPVGQREQPGQPESTYG